MRRKSRKEERPSTKNKREPRIESRGNERSRSEREEEYQKGDTMRISVRRDESSPKGFTFACPCCFLNKTSEIIYHKNKKAGRTKKACEPGKRKGEYNTKKDLLHHLQTVHAEDFFGEESRCPWSECGFAMGSAGSLVDHMMNQHSETFGYVTCRPATCDWISFGDDAVCDEEDTPSASKTPNTEEDAMVVSDSFFRKYPHLQRYLEFLFMYFVSLRENSVDLSKPEENSRNSFIYEEFRYRVRRPSPPSALVSPFLSPLNAILKKDMEDGLEKMQGFRFCIVPDTILIAKTGGQGLSLHEDGCWRPKKSVPPSFVPKTAPVTLKSEETLFMEISRWSLFWAKEAMEWKKLEHFG